MRGTHYRGCNDPHGQCLPSRSTDERTAAASHRPKSYTSRMEETVDQYVVTRANMRRTVDGIGEIEHALAESVDDGLPLPGDALS